AARRAEGKHRRSRQKMMERLLLDGIDAESAGAAIRRQDDLVMFACADEAQAALAFVQAAEARAQVALYASVVEFVPIFCGNRGLHVFLFSISIRMWARIV